MTLIFKNLPKSLTDVLEQRAFAEGRTVAEVALEALTQGLSAGQVKIPLRDLSDVVGTWVKDPAFEEAMKDFEQIDPESWK